MSKYIAEVIGTYALVFAGTGAIIVNHVSGGSITHVGIAITFGLVVMAMIYSVGDVSGAHFNPAVTTAFALSGRLPWRDVAPYIVSQLIGAFAASGCLRMIYGNVAHLGSTLPSGSAAQSFIMETILSFFLMYVILMVSTGPREVGIMAGIAIGATVALEAMFAGPTTGASMNPARSIAPAVVSGNLTSLWIYVVAPVLGAAVAVPANRLTRPGINPAA